jgi:hypothetical protein
MELLEKMPATVVENYTYHNSGNLRFEKVNKAWGLDQKSLSNGAAYADLDNDGDLDLVVNNIEQEPFIYRNNSETLTGNHYLKVKLVGEGGNTFGIGSRIEVDLDDGKQMVQEMLPSRGYQSSVDYGLIFGLGTANKIKKVKVIWPDGLMEVKINVEADQTLILHQENAGFENNGIKSSESVHFTNVTADSIIPYTHKENNFIDFKREQLLPHKVSTQGPKMAKADVNGDGLEDLFIGGAKGSAGTLFIQSGNGRFTPSNRSSFPEDAAAEDLGALFFDADKDKDMDLYVVSGGVDFNEEAPELQDRLYFNDGQGNFKKRSGAIPKMLTSGSCVTSGDVDGDGDLDLFVGGRVVPGSYPVIPRSYILINDGKGNFEDKGSNAINDLGLVTDALWTDFNGDDKADLIVVGEWMGIRIFKNIDGKLTEISESAGTKETSGWWNTIAPGDFDNDGDVDYLLGNFGLNSQLKASDDEPVTLYVKDFDGNGSLDPILCSYIMGESYPVFSKDDLVGQLSGLKARYVNYSDYAGEKMTDIFTEEELRDARILKATDFASSYLENLGNDTFKVSTLPEAAQFSPVYGVIVHDFNADGNPDALLGGNFYGTRVKYGRYDANKGVLLLGDGKGNFQTVNNDKSGLLLNGEVRAITSINRANGEQLMLFAQNDDVLQVYKINKQ